ncbi:MAG: hypothetical protein LBJ63_08345 [Prevotellaceae bacterium]|jgi:hypothetical protein|nr:hypothetical protein [Prevotellaceae bacterium]
MERIIKITVILALLCVLIPQTTQAQCNDDSIVYLKTFYEFQEEHIAEKNNNICFTIRYESEYPYFFGYALEDVKSIVDSVMMKNFETVCDTISADYHFACLKKTFKNTDNVKIISKEDIEKISGNMFWERFFRTYKCSTGLYSVSPIVYNENKTLALFYFYVGYYDIAGGGCFAICEKEDDEWKVKEIIMAMQS